MSEKLQKEFRAPRGVTTFARIVVCELDGYQELDAANWADMKIAESKLKPDNFWDRAKIEQAERTRASIVSVDGVSVQKAGAPWAGFDKWPRKAQSAATRFFHALNDIDEADLEKCVTEVMGEKTEEKVTPRSNPRGGAATDGSSEG